ncbi:flavin reductase family protein [Lacticaseibacillus manihotivorans]|jgi:flavin reductase (DIM6/NTAB) family NADH-FMN oxidoreductase RutF|uniref:Flavin reductase like domain-containing protein n=2 Tax=Lacticaseibacillus manihotivorans TaxID=88233 RepID=A0A0R1QY35_9LACO|nr:flavin reductase [Lacticaseibacillus manihotivorans]KRL49415.1 hypothetical protein FD01_GL000086 [Lacticaseibacillus manihotivorans DSM 13343 = JCM 12514]QFQ92505.1 flavin reductase family protein [Lacticaseibacillus manihotivorans]
MLVPYETVKMYFAYPIFVVGYQDADFGANLTTCSSSYSLGDMFCFGLGGTGHAAAQIQATKRCTISFFGPEYLKQLEYTGFHHAQDKLHESGLAYHLKTGLPILEDASVVLTLNIDSATAVHGAINFVATIQQRLVQESKLQAGKMDVTQLNPPLFAGDGHQRVYRQLSDQVASLGAFTKV